MTNEQEIFNNAMQSQGGIYIPNGGLEIDNILEAMLKIMNEHIKITNDINKNLPNVNIFYTNNMSINACAFKIDTQYFISVNVGAVIKLKEMFDGIVSNQIIKEKIFNNIDELIDSSELLYFAMIFLIAHEHSHIRFGHCDLINHLYGNKETNFLMEATSNCLANDGLFRQTLEYDADCCAIANLINRQLMSRDYHNRDFNSFSHGVSLCTLACYILFKIFDNGEHTNINNYDLDNLENSTHPQPGLRMKYIVVNILTVLIQCCKNNEIDAIQEKIWNYIICFEYANNKKLKIDNLCITIGNTRKGSEHIRRVHNNWKNVRNMLLPFSYDKLADFIEDTGWNNKFID